MTVHLVAAHLATVLFFDIWLSDISAADSISGSSYDNISMDF